MASLLVVAFNNLVGTMTVINSTISGNLVQGFGDPGQISGGGGIANSGILTVRNSTISNNVATDIFEGIGVGGGIIGTMELTHTIVAGNSAGDETFADCFDSPTSQGHNLMGAGTGCPSNGTGDRTVDPTTVFTTVIGPLQNNGGPTQTHALLPGSPAIDAGDAVCTDANNKPLTTDQRGKTRSVDGNGDGRRACDIGAVEFFPIVNNLVALAPGLRTSSNSTPVPGGPAGTFTITATFTNTSTTPLHFPFFGVSKLSGGNLLLNADGSPGGVGATATPMLATACSPQARGCA